MSGGVNSFCPAPTVLSGAVNLNDLLQPWGGDVGTGSNKRYGLLGDPSNPGTAKAANWMTMDVLQDSVRSNQFLSERLMTLSSINEIPKPPDNTFLTEMGATSTGSQNKLPGREAAITEFQIRFKNEFCYYNEKYVQAITNFLTLYTNGDSGAPQAKAAALTLNCKVNTLIAFMNYLSKVNRVSLDSLAGSSESGKESGLNLYNGSIQTTQNELNRQAKVLSDNSNNSEIFKEMVEYTSEKNRANQNMLSLYFTLNVVAIASLFIIARSL